jgi:hypothetical protein
MRGIGARCPLLTWTCTLTDGPTPSIPPDTHRPRPLVLESFERRKTMLTLQFWAGFFGGVTFTLWALLWLTKDVECGEECPWCGEDK